MYIKASYIWFLASIMWFLAATIELFIKGNLILFGIYGLLYLITFFCGLLAREFGE